MELFFTIQGMDFLRKNERLNSAGVVVRAGIDAASFSERILERFGKIQRKARSSEAYLEPCCFSKNLNAKEEPANK